MTASSEQVRTANIVARRRASRPLDGIEYMPGAAAPVTTAFPTGIVPISPSGLPHRGRPPHLAPRSPERRAACKTSMPKARLPRPRETTTTTGGALLNIPVGLIAKAMAALGLL